MTREEALNLLNNSKPKSNNAFSLQMNEAINVIGVTMRKYEEIEKILADRKGKLILNTLVAIIKVVEDGQNTIKD